MFRLTIMLIFTTWSLLSIASSNEITSIYPLGGLSMAKQVNNSPLPISGLSLSSKNFAAYGILCQYQQAPESFNLTFGALFTEMGSHADFGNSSVDEKAPYYQFPFILDYWLDPNVAIGIGVYYGLPAGNVVDSNATGVFTNSSASFDQAHYANSDYGAVLHVALKLPVSKRWFISTDVLWELGVKNVTTVSSFSVLNNSLLVLAGAGFSF